jgi:hypothetical protein
MIVGLVVCLIGILAFAFSTWRLTLSIRRAVRQGVWLGFNRVPARRSENPSRFWAWTTVNVAVVAVYLAGSTYLAWTATGLLRISN